MIYEDVGSKEEILYISKQHKEQIFSKVSFGLVAWKSL